MSRPDAKAPPKTTVSAEGLRYTSKAAGSPFATGDTFAAATMSCFLCGKHRPRSAMRFRRLLGKSHAVCDPSCGS